MRNRHIFVRPARREDAEEFYAWSCATENNDFDPEVPRMPSTITLCAYRKGERIAYMPLQQPFFMESLATRPDASKEEVAMAMKELSQEAVTQAHILGKGEIYFLGSEEGTDLMAQNHLFERVNKPLYRLKLKDLE